MVKAIPRVLPKSIIKISKSLRKILLIMLEPLDYLAKLLNGKKDLPPLYLRRHVGALRDFENSGAEFKVYLKLIGGYNPNEKILDIGCGCGLMAIYLSDYIKPEGKYVGADIYKPAIEWAKKRFKMHTNFSFIHIDVKNNVFNPKGSADVENYSFNFKNGEFDFILLKSVFTHMNVQGINNYLKEISRLLSVKGRTLITSFLLNKKQQELAGNGSNKIEFNFGDGECRYIYKNSPESAIGYKEEYILNMLRNNNLTLKEPIYYGSWSGREDGISFQDMMLIEKKVK